MCPRKARTCVGLVFLLGFASRGGVPQAQGAWVVPPATRTPSGPDARVRVVQPLRGGADDERLPFLALRVQVLRVFMDCEPVLRTFDFDQPARAAELPNRCT
jgi:hypothetical protein